MNFDFAEIFVTGFGFGFGVSTFAGLLGLAIRSIKKILSISADVGEI